ncbi:sigma-70 family RNA polymerase sigma factor [Aliifodinibius sp. S!AR15-10]|uniref:RNA polymerase sigma factor n=1 Tax=Aliifodinibius sp. S!AR15-10 TaxID=2950437 RepID=UPI00285D1506|nr:sigma-70 family RNA polymerase sigma factor [Aliifodinibius sp. S!AR15-10]MDR8392112.1 sigma-70 family RNA polymerase sigma factor [Aliifodinibius sp. S!AR15-10]
MSSSRVDYSELVVALQENRKGKANDLLEELLPRLIDYLKVTMGADEQDAEECVQQAVLNVLEQINKDNIRKEKYIFMYMIRACRHEYYRYAKDKNKFNHPIEDHEQHMIDPAEQYENLLEEERQEILKECLKELRAKSRRFIEYFIDKPQATTKQASDHFNISGANVRTKKSRILSRLHHCVKRKSNQ